MSSIIQSSTSSGAAGLNTSPALQPAALMAWTLHVGAGVRVEADVVGPGLRERLGQRVDRLHHQVDVDRHGTALRGHGVRLQGRTDHRPERQVGHVMVVHYVEVDPVGAGGDDALHLVAQAGEVGRENGRGDAVGSAHPFILANRRKG